ncbi:MAG: hypothetical protein HQL16_00830 [Candidatus Omnitrophica bacterium]|nr:hypothetical protein [Candidatus Omnitrophota bacterium]
MLKGKKILVTSGATAVKIDEVRVITNRSTGEMGRLIAQALVKNKASVTLLESQSAALEFSLKKANLLKFFYYSELEKLLKSELKKGYDCVIHAAAVSDFEPKKVFSGKLPSKNFLTLHLKPTKKLVTKIKKIAPKTFLVGFKLETSLKKDFIFKATKSLFQEAHCDLVLANVVKGREYQACLMTPDAKATPPVSTKKDIVKALIRKIDEILL